MPVTTSLDRQQLHKMTTDMRRRKGNALTSATGRHRRAERSDLHAATDHRPRSRRPRRSAGQCAVISESGGVGSSAVPVAAPSDGQSNRIFIHRRAWGHRPQLPQTGTGHASAGNQFVHVTVRSSEMLPGGPRLTKQFDASAAQFLDGRRKVTDREPDDRPAIKVLPALVEGRRPRHSGHRAARRPAGPVRRAPASTPAHARRSALAAHHVRCGYRTSPGP